MVTNPYATSMSPVDYIEGLVLLDRKNRVIGGASSADIFNNDSFSDIKPRARVPSSFQLPSGVRAKQIPSAGITVLPR
jgi:hypothetical protein